MAAALIRTAEAEIKKRREAPLPTTLSAPVFRTYSPEPARTV
jgi:hypothetical protein